MYYVLGLLRVFDGLLRWWIFFFAELRMQSIYYWFMREGGSFKLVALRLTRLTHSLKIQIQVFCRPWKSSHHVGTYTKKSFDWRIFVLICLVTSVEIFHGSMNECMLKRRRKKKISKSTLKTYRHSEHCKSTCINTEEEKRKNNQVNLYNFPIATQTIGIRNHRQRIIS
jgi:hypothetical protein